MKPTPTERIDAIVVKLTARKRWRRAAHIYGAWLNALRQDGGAASPPSALQWWRYGRLLREAAEHASAAAAFREVVLRLARRGDRPGALLRLAVEQWALCLEASGSPKSAAETRDLGRRIAARIQNDGESLKSLAPSSLLAPVASRCTFLSSLEWESTPKSFEPFVEDGLLTLRDRFRFADESDTWFEFESKAPAESEPRYPHVAVCVKLPWRFTSAGDMLTVLELVNEMNLRNAAVSTCLEPDSGQIAVRAQICYTGFNDGVEPLDDLASAQEEATLNMQLEVIGMARVWDKRVRELSVQLRRAELRPPDETRE